MTQHGMSSFGSRSRSLGGNIACMPPSKVAGLLASSSFVCDENDIAEIKRQLGRMPRGVVGIGFRSDKGVPLVVATAPRLPDGTPFPTVFYVTHPSITAAVSRLEARGDMAEMTARLGADPELADHYRKAHELYLEARRIIGDHAGIGEVAEIDKISAGGMPTRVKCLHVLVGQSLVEGSGANRLGDEALDGIQQWCNIAKIDWTADE